MNFRTKTFKRFLLAFFGLAVAFWFLFMNNLFGVMRISVSLGIALLISLTMFYDPKKYDIAKKKAEHAELDKDSIDKANLE